MAGDNNKEIEVKFNVKNFKAIKRRLKRLGARISQPRNFEVNYRYDTSDRKLSSESKVLRIRQDSKNWITFKGPGKIIDGIRIRQEIEFSISDIDNAQLFLQALGYQLYQSYEKFRTIYILDSAQIMLDELPFGFFVEIEGTDIVSIEKLAEMLGLQWKLNIEAGYLAIYEQLCSAFKMDFGKLSFNDFAGDQGLLRKINIFPADLE